MLTDRPGLQCQRVIRMIRRRWKPVGWSAAVVLMVAMAVLSGCARIQVVDATADGGLIQLREGDLVTVHLRGNPSTGASWAFSQPLDSTVLEPTDEISFSADVDDVCGSPGTFTLRFRAVGPGTTRIALQYGRAWEDDVLDAFAVIVYVH